MFSLTILTRHAQGMLRCMLYFTLLPFRGVFYIAKLDLDRRRREQWNTQAGIFCFSRDHYLLVLHALDRARSHWRQSLHVVEYCQYARVVTAQGFWSRRTLATLAREDGTCAGLGEVASGNLR